MARRRSFRGVGSPAVGANSGAGNGGGGVHVAPLPSEAPGADVDTPQSSSPVLSRPSSRKSAWSPEPAPSPQQWPEASQQVPQPPPYAASAAAAANDEEQHSQSDTIPFRATNMRYLEKPRQLTLLLLLGSVLGLYAFVIAPPDTLRERVQTSVTSMSLVILVYCVLQTRDGLLIRPHPAVWRLIHGTGVLYFLGLAAMVVLDVESAKAALNLLFDDVGKRPTGVVPHAGDATSCVLNYANFMRQLTSMWFYAHVVGWWAKMCVFRDWKFCVILSTLFEIFEVSLQHVVPEFTECWWDSIFMDQLGANLAGIFLGWLTLKYVNSREFAWIAKATKQAPADSPSTFQFSLSRYRWDFFSNTTRFVQGSSLMVCELIMEVNSFLLIHALSIPASAPINKMRMAIYAFLALPAMAELYAYWHGGSKRMGQNLWLISAMLLLEVMMIAKFSYNRLAWMPPMDVAVPWALFTVLVMVFFYLRSSEGKTKLAYTWVDLIGVSSLLPLLYLFKGWNWEL